MNKMLRVAVGIGGGDVSTASYDTVSLDVSGEDGFPRGIAFKLDGTKLYLIGGYYDSVYQYSLSTAWDLSTASYDTVSFSVQEQEGSPRSVTFKTDGTKMYVVGSGDVVYQYSLSTAWNVDTASYDSVSFGVAGQDTSVASVTFKTDGTKMYVLGGVTDKVYQYSLSTPWNVDTASYDSVSFYLGDEDPNPRSMAFKPDGTKLFVISGTNDVVYKYSLSTPWNVSTAFYDSTSPYLGIQDLDPYGLAFKPDGTKMYTLGNENEKIYQYSLC